MCLIARNSYIKYVNFVSLNTTNGFDQILQFWHDRKLPLEPLEEHIKDNIRLLAPLLGELLLLQEVPAGSDKSPLCVTLSQDIYFAVVTSYTQIMDENFRKGKSVV